MLQTKKGFTIIELLLAMTMVSFLMMAIAMMILQMMSLMTKGNTFRELNATGRTVNDDFTRSFNSLQTIEGWDGSFAGSVGEGNFTYIKNNEWGVFCTGKFSYLWNIMGNNQIAYGDTSNLPPVKLIRVADSARRYCSSSSLGGIGHLSFIPQEEAKELIGNGEIDLRLKDIQFERIAEDAVSNQSIIKITYILATREGVDIVASACDPTGDRREYCAINKFELIVRTLGRG